MRWSAYRYVPLILGALAFAACGDDDETGPERITPRRMPGCSSMESTGRLTV